MTVEELIEELKKFPKDTPVHIGWHELTKVSIENYRLPNQRKDRKAVFLEASPLSCITKLLQGE